MKATEVIEGIAQLDNSAYSIVDEARMDPKIKEVMKQKGYKFLGKGQDQDAYLAPDGTILKIFGYEHNKLSRGQKSFIDFANFCMANPNNPFLPQFGGWEPFKFNGFHYLQIKCERLFDFNKIKMYEVADMLETLVYRVQRYGATKGVKEFLQGALDHSWNTENERASVGKLVTLLGGEEQLNLFAQTLEQLYKIAAKKGYGFDLHAGNFMVGSDGEIVINDPFFTGTWRS